MKAVVKLERGPGNVVVRDVPVPRPRPGWLLVKVAAAGVCGTDIHIYHDQFPYWPPVVLGHEFSGTVAEVGEGAEGWRVGDRVVAEPHSGACGVCDLCRTGNHQICASKRSPGWGIDGAFAEYVTLPAHLFHRIPESVSLRSAAVAEPLAVVLCEVVERGRLQAGETVVVLGAGPIGLLAAAVSRLGGASKVILIGTDKDEGPRFEVARAIPADIVVNVDRQDARAAVMDATAGRGADLVVEASGSPAAAASTVSLVRKRGRITAVGLPGKGPVAFPWEEAMFKVCDLMFNLSSSYTSWEKAVALLAAGRVDPGIVVSHELALSDWREGFDLVESGRAIKVLLVPGKG